MLAVWGAIAITVIVLGGIGWMLARASSRPTPTPLKCTEPCVICNPESVKIRLVRYRYRPFAERELAGSVTVNGKPAIITVNTEKENEG